MRVGRLHCLKRAVVALGLAGVPSLARAEPARPSLPFDMNFEQFRQALDAKIRQDTSDKTKPDWSTVNRCSKKADIYTCTFHDAGFQSSVAEFKKMDLLNGRFSLQLKLVVKIERGSVSKVQLTGNRADPLNLMQFIGTTMNIMQLFEPNIVEGEGKTSALANQLGLIRGDAAPSIGEPVTVIKPYAAITCIAAPSSLTTGVGCEWVPRS